MGLMHPGACQGYNTAATRHVVLIAGKAFVGFDACYSICEQFIFLAEAMFQHKQTPKRPRIDRALRIPSSDQWNSKHDRPRKSLLQASLTSELTERDNPILRLEVFIDPADYQSNARAGALDYVPGIIIISR
jgi:hypothetical protein